MNQNQNQLLAGKPEFKNGDIAKVYRDGGPMGAWEKLFQGQGQVPISPVKMDSDGVPFWFWSIYAEI